MGLKGVHIVFIVAATSVMAMLGLWCLQQYRAEGGMDMLAAGVVSLVGGVGLLGYGTWFLRKMGRLP
jgi:hypothetical protein